MIPRLHDLNELHIPRVVFNGNDVQYVDNNGRMTWNYKGYIGTHVQGTSSSIYKIKNFKLSPNTFYNMYMVSLEDVLYREDTTPEMETECGGALDEFLDGFNPQNHTERSDKQNEC